jgi:hypothetical protein
VGLLEKYASGPNSTSGSRFKRTSSYQGSGSLHASSSRGSMSSLGELPLEPDILQLSVTLKAILTMVLGDGTTTSRTIILRQGRKQYVGTDELMQN